MKWLKDYTRYKLIKESKQIKKSPVSEICVAMCLINPNFLDNLLDKGLKARYSENNKIFLTDLKNLLLSKNRLKLGLFDESEKKFREDSELSKSNLDFESFEFDIEKDWKKLHDWRTTARSISDKLLIDEKLTSEMIKTVYWIGPNKSKEVNEDLVIELYNEKQYSISLQKNISLQKTVAFSTILDILIGEDSEKLFSEKYIDNWNKIAQEFVRITFEGVNKPTQALIERFLDYSRIDTIQWFDFFNIRHRDPKFKYLGEHFKEFDKNYTNLSDFLNDVWNKKELFFDFDNSLSQWNEVKRVVMNSKILEDLLTSSLKSKNKEDIKRLETGLKEASGVAKMKFIKIIVEKLGSIERDIYQISSNGLTMMKIPSRDWFRDNYDDLKIEFDYHVSFGKFISEESENFNMKIHLIKNSEKLLTLDINVGSSSKLSNRLSSKVKFDIPSNFFLFPF